MRKHITNINIMGIFVIIIIITNNLIQANATKIIKYQELTPKEQSVGCFSPFKLNSIYVKSRTGQAKIEIVDNLVLIKYDGLSQYIEITITQTNLDKNNNTIIQEIKQNISNKNGKSLTKISLPRPISNDYDIKITIKNKKETAYLGKMKYIVEPSTCEAYISPLVYQQ
jgi:hypothetical protein